MDDGGVKDNGTGACELDGRVRADIGNRPEPSGQPNYISALNMDRN